MEPSQQPIMQTVELLLGANWPLVRSRIWKWEKIACCESWVEQGLAGALFCLGCVSSAPRPDLPYLASARSGTPFVGLIFNQTRNVYQIWLESKLVNAVFRRLSNVKYGTACGCWTRAFLYVHPWRGEITTLHLEIDRCHHLCLECANEATPGWTICLFQRRWRRDN